MVFCDGIFAMASLNDCGTSRCYSTRNFAQRAIRIVAFCGKNKSPLDPLIQGAFVDNEALAYARTLRAVMVT